VRRRNPPNAGHWGFPGGRLEAGETLRCAARRELREETGVEAEPGAPFSAVDVIQHDAEGNLSYHFTLVAVTLSFVRGTPAAADDAEAADWFNPRELPQPLCTDVADLVAASSPRQG
jgi:ADP-ribose pyrophosphatase YjhB (NUDIX family)